MRTFTTLQIKQIEKNATLLGISYQTLMQNAGDACVQFIVKHEYLLHKSVVLLCGNGNNGGDGFVMAKLLQKHGCSAVVILCNGQPTTKLATNTFAQLNQDAPVTVLDLHTDTKSAMFHVSHADILVDAVFGTGFHGEFFGAVSEFLKYCNQSTARKIAIDIPSGINGDTSKIAQNCFLAEDTLVLGAYKIAHQAQKTKAYCGRLHLLDIGIPKAAFFEMDFKKQLLTQPEVASILKPRPSDSHKGDYGTLLIVAGSSGMCGAAMMATLAAMRCGAGRTVIASDRSTTALIAPHLMEATSLALPVDDQGNLEPIFAVELLQQQAKTATACVIGCGLGQGPHIDALVRELLSTLNIPIILDADGINTLQGDIDISSLLCERILLTPHPKEFARLTGVATSEVLANPAQVAYDFSKQYHCTLLLKGHRSVLARPSGNVFENQTGCAALAKGGSGDVLSGMLGGFVAQGYSFAEAGKLTMWVHGLCAEQCASTHSNYGVLARDLIAQIPCVLRQLELFG